MRKFALFVGSLATAVLAASATAQVVFSDDFDGRTGALTGQTADTGQTWGNFTYFGSYPSFGVSTDFGMSGTEGAGTKDSSTFYGNTVTFSPVSNGPITLDMDMRTYSDGFGGSTTPLKEFFLQDSVNNTVAAIYWQQSNTSIAFEGLGISDPPHATGQSASAVAVMHVTLNMDLTNKTISYSWSGTDLSTSSPISGSVNIGSYSGAFAPNTLHIWGRGESNAIASGYDNIVLQSVPEPAALSLFALSGAGLIGRRSRRA